MTGINILHSSPMQYFKVRNTAIVPCHMSWVKTLLTDEELKAYEAFKETPDYLGYDEEDRTLKRKLPEAVKVRPFYEQLGKDVRIKMFDATKDGRSARYEWQFCIGPNTEKIIKDSDLAETRRTCEKYEVPVDREDTVRDLAKKLREKFGPDERILTETQWLESGLQAREYKEIKLRMRPGETVQRIQTEGYLKAEPMTDIDVEVYQEKQEAKKSKK